MEAVSGSSVEALRGSNDWKHGVEAVSERESSEWKQCLEWKGGSSAWKR